ncbi:hypothetical protein BDY24DRAFT_443361 [Mrakia frigida]|uniref:uncharacterized protein n=1 Tax=Mrakia frigida TaxID=29902 RepID=UPI003FCC1AB7
MAIAGDTPTIGSSPVPKHKEWNYSVGARPVGDQTSSTKNPHYPGVKKAFWVWLNRWYEAEGKLRYEGSSDSSNDKEKSTSLAMIDLGCGTGEITESLLQWHHLGRYQTKTAAASDSSPLSSLSPLGAALPAPPPPPPQTATPLHPILQTNMKQNAIPAHRPAFIPPNRRRAPVAPAPAAPVASTSAAVVEPDVAATTVQLVGGQYSSLVTPPNLPEGFKKLEILPVLTDEATLPLFTHRLPSHTPPPLPLSFLQVSLGKLPFPTSYTPTEPLNPFPKFDFVVCSFGLHLVGAFELRNDGVRSYGAVKVEEKKKMDSELFGLLWELSGRAEWLVVLGTGKKPVIRDGSGWVRWDLATWAPARHQGFGGKKGGEDDDEEDEEDEEDVVVEGAEELKDSAIEVMRDRVRLRVYKSVNGSA